MQFVVDPRSPVSPGDQLADQVRFAVAAGRLTVGARLPSVRDLARLVRLNPNTVSRAWRELELTGVLESRRGSGMYVADGAVDIAQRFRARALAERLGRAVGDALSAGLAAAEVQELVASACAAWSVAGGSCFDSADLAGPPDGAACSAAALAAAKAKPCDATPSDAVPSGATNSRERSGQGTAYEREET